MDVSSSAFAASWFDFVTTSDSFYCFVEIREYLINKWEFCSNSVVISMPDSVLAKRVGRPLHGRQNEPEDSNTAGTDSSNVAHSPGQLEQWGRWKSGRSGSEITGDRPLVALQPHAIRNQRATTGSRISDRFGIA
jgi:hypothetical protein